MTPTPDQTSQAEAYLRQHAGDRIGDLEEARESYRKEIAQINKAFVDGPIKDAEAAGIGTSRAAQVMGVSRQHLYLMIREAERTT